MNVIGCDPGLTGAFALFVDSRLVKVIDMPVTLVETGVNKVRFSGESGVSMVRGTRNILRPTDVYAALEDMAQHLPVHLFLEQVNGRPNQMGMFEFGRGVGLVEMAAHALGIPMTHVAPARWQNAMAIKGGKESARERAIEMLPDHADLFKRKGDHGRAEAAMIGLYGIQAMLPGQLGVKRRAS